MASAADAAPPVVAPSTLTPSILDTSARGLLALHIPRLLYLGFIPDQAVVVTNNQGASVVEMSGSTTRRLEKPQRVTQVSPVRIAEPTPSVTVSSP